MEKRLGKMLAKEHLDSFKMRLDFYAASVYTLPAGV